MSRSAEDWPRPLVGGGFITGQRTNKAPSGRQLVELDRATALTLLAGVDYGRVVFTSRALPAIRPVNHVVDAGDVIIRTHLGAAITDAVDGNGVVVAYEADEIDSRRRLGWSVVVTGYARPVTDEAALARFETALTPWVDMAMNAIIRIHSEIVTGFRLIEAG